MADWPNGIRILSWLIPILVAYQIGSTNLRTEYATTTESGAQSTTITSQQPEQDTLTPAERADMLASFDYIWDRIRETYWDPDLGGVDWQRARDELRPKLEQVNNRRQALSVLNELVNRMKVSHFSVIPKSAYESLHQTDEPGSRHGWTGIDARVVDDQILVVDVHPESPAEKQGVRAGWIITRIGQLDAKTQLQELKREFNGNPHQRVILASAANSRLRGRIGDELTIVFLDGQNQEQLVTIELVPIRGEKIRLGHLPDFRVWVDIDSLEGDIGYFRFNAFMNPNQVMSAFNRFVEEHRNAPGIVIDVRGNQGGSGGIAMGMIGWLMRGSMKSFGKVILRNNELNLVARPRPKPYDKPVVVLIDELSVSAAEFFASGIRDVTPARLIGTRTAGAVLGSQIEKLPTGDGFQFAAANFISGSTGQTLEGVGVAPHEVVPPNRESLLRGTDPAIAAAVRWIREQSQ